MELEVLSHENDKPVPCEFASCAPAGEGHVSMDSNRRPHVLVQSPRYGAYALNSTVEA